MASDELFLTIQLEPARQGIRIDPGKYQAVHAAITQNLRRYGSMTFTQLGALVEEQLQDTFSGSVLWYYTSIKLEMEARGEIRRVPNSRPQVIEIV
jgi:uncharacterized protein DUF6958